MRNWQATELPGVMLIDLARSSDRRGSFTKLFHAPTSELEGVKCDFVEQFYTVSRRNVLRGMHYQKAPHAHGKLVTCVSGQILDVVVDVRPGATFGRCISFVLSLENGRAIYMPPGYAHGFLTLSEQATTHYSVTSVHAPQSDSGILWSSIDFHWPIADPILSDRDLQLPPLDSPSR